MASLAGRVNISIPSSVGIAPTRRLLGMRVAWAYAVVAILLGVYALVWLWQVKDLGITVDWTGELLSVEPGSLAAQEGIRPGDRVSFDDFQRLKTISASATVGQLIDVTVWRGSEPLAVKLSAEQGPMPRVLSLSIEPIVGILFTIIGMAPLVARRRGLSLWVFFFACQLTGLFLITDVPRSYHLRWAELLAYIVLPLFPAVVFHFHTLFPQQRLGRLRTPLVLFVYVVAAILLPLDLISLWDYSFYLSDGWQLVITAYEIAALLASLAMLVRTYATTRDLKVRSQLRAFLMCSGFGLLVPAALMLPMILLNLDLNDVLKTIAVFSAVAVPAGYAYSMLRYNLLIDGLLWRPSVVRVAYSSILMLGFVALLVAIWPSGRVLPTSEALVAWLAVVLAIVVLAGVLERLGKWAEKHLFKGGRYVEFLAAATDELQRIHDLEHYVEFFTRRLADHLQINGSLVFLAPGPSDTLILRGWSPTLRLPVPEYKELALLPESHLRSTFAHVEAPIQLSALMVPSDGSYLGEDAPLLRGLRESGIELVIPLVLSHQQLVGLVALGSKLNDEAFSAEELNALWTLGKAASITAENVLRLEELELERRRTAELAQSISATQEAERKRISRELHDSTLQDLSVISRALTQMREQVQGIVVELEERQLDLESRARSEVVSRQELGLSAEDALNFLSEWHDKLEVLLGEDERVVASSSMGATQAAYAGDGVVDAILVGLAGRPSIEGLVAQTRITSQRARAICNELHPTYLDVPLVAALRESVVQFQTQNPNVCIELNTRGDEPSQLADDTKLACKKVMEQALHNALRHGRPSRIAVDLEFSAGGTTTLFVTDNGCGFEPRSFKALRLAGHRGLDIMRERAEIVNGVLDIQSTPAKGSRISLVVAPRTPHVA